MEDTGVSGAVRELLACDPAVADRDELATIVRNSAKLRSFADLVDIRAKRRAEELAAAGRAESATALLLDEGRRSGAEVRNTRERDRICTEIPPLEDALAAGACSADHLDALARLTRNLTDAERSELQLEADRLVASATHDYVSQFERTARNLIDDIRARCSPGSEAAELDRQRKQSKITSWVDRGSGMHKTLVELDPLRHAELHSAIDAHLARLRQDPANADVPFGQLHVQALLAATSGAAPADRIPSVIVHVDARTLCEGRHAGSLCETVDGRPIPVATARRLCCEAVLSAVVVEADGTTRRLTAELRTATREQRRALAAMYATCAHPHCEVGFSRCRIHHVVWYSVGGATVLDNLLPLCETHHHLVHEGGWRLELDPDRTLTWIRPDGQVWLVHHSPNRRPNAASSSPAPRSAADEEPADWLRPALC